MSVSRGILALRQCRQAGSMTIQKHTPPVMVRARARSASALRSALLTLFDLPLPLAIMNDHTHTRKHTEIDCRLTSERLTELTVDRTAALARPRHVRSHLQNTEPSLYILRVIRLGHWWCEPSAGHDRPSGAGHADRRSAGRRVGARAVAGGGGRHDGAAGSRTECVEAATRAARGDGAVWSELHADANVVAVHDEGGCTNT